MSWNVKWSDSDYSELACRVFDWENLESWDRLDRYFGRGPGASRAAFNRICHDETDYLNNKRVYNLGFHPRWRKGRPFTAGVMKYIRVHISYPNGHQMLIKTMAANVGHSEQEVRALVKRKGYKKKPPKKKKKKGDKKPKPETRFIKKLW